MAIHHSQHPQAAVGIRWRGPVLWTVVLVALAYLLTRHANHVVQFLPLAVLFACPLMHLLHHRHQRR